VGYSRHPSHAQTAVLVRNPLKKKMKQAERKGYEKTKQISASLLEIIRHEP